MKIRCNKHRVRFIYLSLGIIEYSQVEFRN